MNGAKVYILVSTASHSVRTMFEETNMKTVSAEMLGTFFLVFFGITAFASSGDVFAGALTLGLTLMVLMHVFGPISGCHLNPAVTIGNLMSKKISQDDAIGYMGAQIVGATLGFVLFKFLNPGTDDSVEYTRSICSWSNTICCFQHRIRRCEFRCRYGCHDCQCY